MGLVYLEDIEAELVKDELLNQVGGNGDLVTSGLYVYENCFASVLSQRLGLAGLGLAGLGLLFRVPADALKQLVSPAVACTLAFSLLRKQVMHACLRPHACLQASPRDQLSAPSCTLSVTPRLPPPPFCPPRAQDDSNFNREPFL